jgi:hypothetical protein
LSPGGADGGAATLATLAAFIFCAVESTLSSSLAVDRFSILVPVVARALFVTGSGLNTSGFHSIRGLAASLSRHAKPFASVQSSTADCCGQLQPIKVVAREPMMKCIFTESPPEQQDHVHHCLLLQKY